MKSVKCGFYCIAFIEYMLAEKLLLDILIYIPQMTIKRMNKQYPSILKINMVE